MAVSSADMRASAERARARPDMQVISSWTGRQADALRQALRMPKESFAAHLGVGARTVSYWRQRPESVPQQQMQEILDAALEQASDLDKAQCR
jgi:DNA-binding transcriptional regulator YiaG